jgi:hypothetical protein
MAVNLTGILSDLSSAIPSSQDVLQNVLVGAGASVVLAGLKSQSGLDAIDPLHIIHKDGSQAVVGPARTTISAAALAALPADARAQLLAQNPIITN